jgi:hypothetical protein
VYGEYTASRLVVDVAEAAYYQSRAFSVILQNHKTDQPEQVSLAELLRYCPLFTGPEDGAGLSPEGQGFFKTTSNKKKKKRGVHKDEIVTFGDYLEYHGMMEIISRATSMRLEQQVDKGQTPEEGKRFLDVFPSARAPAVQRPVVDNLAFTAGGHDPEAVLSSDRAATLAAETWEGIKDSRLPDAFNSLQGLASRLLGDGDVAQLGNASVESASQAAKEALTSRHAIGIAKYHQLFSYMAAVSDPADEDAANRRLHAIASTARDLLGAKSAPQGTVPAFSKLSPQEVRECFHKLAIGDLTRKHLLWFVWNDVPLPLVLACVRFLQDIMSSMIVGIPGRETGELLIGDANFQLSHIGAQKMLYGFATVYLGAVIYQAERLAVIPNIRPYAHTLGGGMEFWDP